MSIYSQFEQMMMNQDHDKSRICSRFECLLIGNTVEVEAMVFTPQKRVVLHIVS